VIFRHQATSELPARVRNPIVFRLTAQRARGESHRGRGYYAPAGNTMRVCGNAAWKELV